MTEPDVTKPDDRRRLMYFQYVFPWKLTDHGQQQFVANVILMPNVSQISQSVRPIAYSIRVGAEKRWSLSSAPSVKERI